MAKTAEVKAHSPPIDIAEGRARLARALREPLGYTRLLGLETRDALELTERVKQGFSYRAVERFQKTVRLPMAQVAELLHIPARTLSRRKERGRLHADESDRLLRASRIFARALDLLEGDVEGARGWLTQSQPALGGSTPLQFASTEVGAREVEQLIGRLEYGIAS